MGARTFALARCDPRFQLVSQVVRERNGARPIVDGTIDAVIDFSSDFGAAEAARLAVAHRAALLVGTTGLSRQTLAVIEVAARTVPTMIAPNTSLGAAVLAHLAASAAHLLGPAYQVSLIETHHAGKRDAPSGTALRIAEAFRRGGVDLPPERIHAIRTGDVVGEHTVELAAAGERLRLCHIATTRDLFARGAMTAAAWLVGRPPGLHSMEELAGLGG